MFNQARASGIHRFPRAIFISRSLALSAAPPSARPKADRQQELAAQAAVASHPTVQVEQPIELAREAQASTQNFETVEDRRLESHFIAQL